MKERKLIVILGPTASGKSKMAVKIAKRFKGEVISADSRQVYKGMDIGTGKITKKEMKGIPHYLLDVASPKRKFTVAQYQKLAIITINKIFKKNKIPILCGGTGFYIQAVVDGITIPEVPPDWRLRSNLEQLSTKKLFNRLKKLDPRRAKTIEKKNKRRLIRAIEIISKINGPVPILKKRLLPYPVLMIGIRKEGEENKFSSSPFAAARVNEELKKIIEKRFLNWLKSGFIKEVKKLKKMGLSFQRIEEFGLHYKWTAKYLKKEVNYKEMVENSLRELQNYAKRQMTWFSSHGGSASARKCNHRIHWVKNYQEAKKLVKNFLKEKGSS